jgi:L-lactate dehydrogenase complex protein LldG
MNSRENILAAVLQNQPPLSPLPDISMFRVTATNISAQYSDIFREIGGQVVPVSGYEEIGDFIEQNFDTSMRMISSLPELSRVAELISPDADPHSFEDVELAVITSPLAVAENGAVWLTEKDMGQRIIPYISQHLAVVLRESSIVSTLHDAYARIGTEDYGFGGFIGGPSKTADIEQALVLGAHGPLSMTIFLILNS